MGTGRERALYRPRDSLKYLAQLRFRSGDRGVHHAAGFVALENLGKPLIDRALFAVRPGGEVGPPETIVGQLDPVGIGLAELIEYPGVQTTNFRLDLRRGMERDHVAHCR